MELSKQIQRLHFAHEESQILWSNLKYNFEAKPIDQQIGTVVL